MPQSSKSSKSSKHHYEAQGGAYSFYLNAPGQIPFPSSIHPGDDNGKRGRKNWQQHRLNHQTRAEINRARSNDKRNPNFHGVGRHAGVKAGH